MAHGDTPCISPSGWAHRKGEYYPQRKSESQDIEHINVHKQPCEHWTHIHMDGGDGAEDEALLQWQMFV
jgi:hypothetical protein